MKLLVLGATGRTGRLATERALRRGHEVTAVVRNLRSFEPTRGLEIVKGDPRDSEFLASLFVGHDAVLSCLGQRSRADAALLRESAAAVIRAAKVSGLRRYLVLSQGLLFPTKSLVVILLRWMLARYVADTTAMETLVKQSELDWTIVRPPRLIDGEGVGKYYFDTRRMPAGKRAMQRGDLADFLLDEVEMGSHLHQVVGITSA